MATKKNASSASNRRFALGVNLGTLAVVVIGALVCVALWFLFTSPAMNRSSSLGDELSEKESELTEVRAETSRWRTNDPTLIATMSRLRAVEAAIPVDPQPNATAAKASAASAVSSAVTSSGVTQTGFQADNTATPFGKSGLSSTTLTVRVSGTPAQVTAFTRALQSSPGVLTSIDAVAMTSSNSGQVDAWVRARFWFTATTPLFPAGG